MSDPRGLRATKEDEMDRDPARESSVGRWVCGRCGLVAEAPDPPTCFHPGYPYGPGFAPPGGARGFSLKIGEPLVMVPYTGTVAPGLTDPVWHDLMGA